MQGSLIMKGISLSSIDHYALNYTRSEAVRLCIAETVKTAICTITCVFYVFVVSCMLRVVWLS